MGHKLTITFLALPFVAFIVMIGYSMVGNMGAHFTLPVQGYDPRSLLYGHYINISINSTVLQQIAGKCGCLKSSGIEYKSCEEARNEQCEALLDSKNTTTMRSLSMPTKLYVDETTAPTIEKAVREKPYSLMAVVTLNNDAVVIHGLLLDGKPVKAMPSANPFESK